MEKQIIADRMIFANLPRLRATAFDALDRLVIGAMLARTTPANVSIEKCLKILEDTFRNN